MVVRAADPSVIWVTNFEIWSWVKWAEVTAKPGGTAGNVSRPVLWDGCIFFNEQE